MQQQSSQSPRFDEARARLYLPDAHLVAPPTYRRPRLVSTGGATSLANSFSGSSLYLAKSGIQLGVLDGAFTLYDGNGLGLTKLKGAVWKATRALRRQPVGAFKFTDIFQDSLWKQYMPLLAGCDIIHNTQLVGKHFIENRHRYDIRSIFYVDGTLREYLDEYGPFDLKKEDPAIFEQAIDSERNGYADADLVVAMSRMTAETLSRYYGVPQHRISVVPPGANIDPHFEARPSTSPSDEFVVGAVGYYPERKGFARLIDAVRQLRQAGENISVHVIGNLPQGYAPGDGLTHYGIIDKSKEMERYYNVVRRFNVGCQLSYAEMVGIAILEYLRLGIPIMATSVGGATDVLEKGGSISVSRDITSSELATQLLSLIRNPSRYKALKAEAEALRDWASWARAARSLDDLLCPTAGG